MASVRSLYDVLNVSHDAEGAVIEAAYRALMKKYHPDQAADGAANGTMSAAEINQAFAILRDPKRRAGYDRHERNEWSRNQPVHLSEPAYQPPPRRSGFAWTGWLVAVLLGAILYAVLNGRGGLIVPPPAANESASAELDHRTQPVKIAPALDATTAPTAIDREIMLSEAKAAASRRGQAAIEEAVGAAAQADVPPIVLEPEPEPVQLRQRTAPTRPHARAIRRNGRAVARSREDEDFLKREGYIY
jgi:curved DNA-binding protein CbpA